MAGLALTEAEKAQYFVGVIVRWAVTGQYPGECNDGGANDKGDCNQIYVKPWCGGQSI